MAVRRHRVAVDQQAGAEAPARVASISAASASWNGCQQRAHPPLGLGEAQLAAIDRLARGDDAGDGAQPGADARRWWCSPSAAARPANIAGVELPRLAVGVAEGAREGGRQQRRAVAPGAAANSSSTKLSSLRRSAERIEPRGGDEIGRVVAAGMRRGEHHRRGLAGRPPQRHRAGLAGEDAVRRATGGLGCAGRVVERRLQGRLRYGRQIHLPIEPPSAVRQQSR